jgi:hypothetical protein
MDPHGAGSTVPASPPRVQPRIRWEVCHLRTLAKAVRDIAWQGADRTLTGDLTLPVSRVGFAGGTLPRDSSPSAE